MAFGSTIHVGNSLDGGTNVTCGNNVTFNEATLKSLEFPCNKTFGRYVSVEQNELNQLRFCEIEVFAGM